MGGSQKGRQQGRGRIEGREGGGQEGGRGQAHRQRQRVEKMMDRGTTGKWARGMAAGCGVGNLALRESAPRSGACDWPRVAMVAGAAFTGIHCSFCGGGGARGRGGVLVVHIIHVCLCSAKCAPEADSHVLCDLRGILGWAKKQVYFACYFSAGIKISWSNTKTLNLKLSMAASKTSVGSASLDGAEDRQTK